MGNKMDSNAPTPISTAFSDMIRPRYWTLLQDPKVETVFVTGCGGGFDFVHSLTIIPALLKMGKKVIIGSYSFGDPCAIDGRGLCWLGVMSDEDRYGGRAEAYTVDGSCIPSRSYGPEVGMCQFLDIHYPRDEVAAAARPALEARHIDTPQNSLENYPIQDKASRWSVYAYNARTFNVIQLRAFYTRICNEHQVDAILAMDGGSDSLMAGDEAGLGDPIEDAVTIAAIATLRGAAAPAPGPAPGSADATSHALPLPIVSTDGESEGQSLTRREARRREACRETHFDTVHLAKPLTARILVAIGVGCDRFNGVSDAATFRAVAELSKLTAGECVSSGGHPSNPQESGFLGSMALEATSVLSQTYHQAIEYMQNRAQFRSVIANSICETSNGSGSYGCTDVPRSLKRRVAPGELFLWPFMSFHFAFWLPCVFQRAQLGPKLLQCTSVTEMYTVLHKYRDEKHAQGELRAVEGLPGTATDSAF